MNRRLHRVFDHLRNGTVARTIKRYLARRRKYYAYQVSGALTQQKIVTTLKNLGLSPGDLVCVHSSFSSLGYVEGGPGTFIKALEEVVGSTGTIMMPTFSMTGSMLSYLESGEIYDIRKTPSKVGALTETFRNWPGVTRSLHPTNSVAAKGRLAHDLLSGHHRSIRPFGLETPFGRLAALDGKILMINTHIHSFLHHVQDLVDFPNLYLNETRTARVLDDKGVGSIVETKVMRTRVPYYLILPGTDGFEEDFVLLHDYALIFPESRATAVRKAGFRLQNHPEIMGRLEFLQSKNILRTDDLGAARIGLLQSSSFLQEIRPQMEALLTRFRTRYDIERIQGLNLPYL
ncbi:MAG: AAC(3) family N-acetyltransferase [Nitrospira sp.]|nr:AAC(3) family N-acetyltransferase [Nitrospira sp.]